MNALTESLKADIYGMEFQISVEKALVVDVSTDISVHKLVVRFLSDISNTIETKHDASAYNNCKRRD